MNRNRPIQMSINRVMCGLPITDSERAELNAHIERCERPQNRFFVVVPLLALALAGVALGIALWQH